MTDSQETYWICGGTRQEPHPQEEVEVGERCPICNSDYANTQKKDGSSLPLGKIFAVTLLACLAIGGYYLIKDLLINGKQQEQVTSKPKPETSPPQTITNPLDYSWQPERFTRGQRTLFPGVVSPNLENGIEAFKAKEYRKAIAFFNKAVVANRNEPEPLILLNNAKAYQQENPLTLAVVVPVRGNVNSAKEMLRGVAMAQNEFNTSGGINNRLLEIVIANDENKPEISQQVAEQLANDRSILGVIGHNSSGASQAGLKIYEAKGLAMISPTSSSTSLQGSVFFRTTPSDAAAGKKLAQYVTQKLNISQVVIFYNPNSNYSKSLRKSFESSFQGTVVESIDMSEPNFSAKGEVAISIFQKQAQAALLFPNTKMVEVAREIAIANRNIAPKQRLKLLGGDALYNPQTLIQGGENIEGLVLVVPWSINSPSSQRFRQAGNKQWGGSVSWRTAMSYDATQAFIDSFSSNNNTHSSILNGLKQVKLSPTETSGIEIKFTFEGERQSDPVLVTVTKGVLEKPAGTEFGFKLLE